MAHPRIMVVEDDSIIVMELETRLRSLGYDVCATSPSGEDAIEKVVELRPDLVLMDVRLKGEMDGVETAAAIRAHLDVPVIYLTAYADEDTLQRAKATEPYAYIIKPFEERELQTAIEMALYRHHMEQQVQNSQRWLAATLESIGDAVLVADEKGIVSLMNPVAEKLIGWHKQDALGREMVEVLLLVPEKGQAMISDPVKEALEKELAVDLAGYSLVAAGGREIPIDGSTALIRGEQGDVQGVVLVLRDVSRRRQEELERENLQARLFQAQKMEAVGVSVGDIAHDFNNLMTTIVGSSSLVLAEMAPDDPLRPRIERVKDAGDRANWLTRQILALTQQQAPEPEILELGSVLVDLNEVLQRLVGESAGMVYDPGSGSGYVKADPMQMEQVITNLVVNAREAMLEGGRVIIKVETISLKEDPAQLGEGARSGDFVCLSVADTGSGMDASTLPQVFDPFFSTKPKGAGLGLSIVRDVIQQYGGWVEVESQLGLGSTFRVYLPALPADGEQIHKAPPSLSELGGVGQRVLLVEDNPGVCEAISDMLQTGGYKVVEAGSAAEALVAFEQAGEDLALVLSDVVLPDHDGVALVDQLVAQSPNLRVLLTSGYADQRVQWPIILERGYPFLHKPFGVSELLAAVGEVLQGT